MTADPAAPPSRLGRRLGLGDAVVVGLGSMLGAGVFVAVGPAATAAGTGLLPALGLAAVVAACNASSSARLAARYPSSGGTYLYGRERLSAFWGFLAGCGFLVGKTASCAAMALTFATYVAPSQARLLALSAVVVVTALDLRGVRATARTTMALVVVVLVSLAVLVIAVLSGDNIQTERVLAVPTGGLGGLLQAAAVLFFAFAGYARIATLGEEVIDPARTIPRAIALALALTLGVYAVVAVTALAAVGPEQLAAAAAPLSVVAAAADQAWLAPILRLGAAVACLGVLLSLSAGLARTAFAMAHGGDLPSWFTAVSARGVPARAQVAIGVAVAVVVAVGGLRGAIGVSAFTVLGYYAVTHAAALTLPGGRGARIAAISGLLGCLLLAASLPPAAIATGTALLGVGALIWLVRSRRSGQPASAASRRA